MRSTEPISAPDYPFRGTVWPQFSEKRHSDFRNRAFQSPNGSLATIPCPEKATFSNDAGRFPGTRELVARGEVFAEKTGRVTQGPEQGRRSEMRSTEPISAPDYSFRGTVWPQFTEKRHPPFRNRAFQSPTGSLATIPYPEKALFSNDSRQFDGTHGQVAIWGYPQEKTGRVTQDPEPGKAI